MFKRVAVFVVAVVLAFAIAGCSSGTSSAASSSFSDLAWPKDRVTEEVPAPSFSLPPNKVTADEGIDNVFWKGLEDQEVADYVEQLKAAGFTFKASETKNETPYKFAACNSEDTHSATSISIEFVAKSEKADSHLHITVVRPK